MLPFADTAAMNAHLAEIARTVAPGAHALLVLDGAGWHGGKNLVVPDAISLLTLPPYAPELNPVENVWQFLRSNWLAISVFDGYDAIVTACRPSDGAGARRAGDIRAPPDTCRRSARAPRPRRRPRSGAARSRRRQRTTPSRSGSGPASTQAASSAICAGRELPRPRRRPPVRKPGEPLGVVAMHPVPQRLAVHPAGPRRAGPVRALQHQRQRQHPARRPRIPRPARLRPQLRRRQISPRHLDRRHPCLQLLASAALIQRSERLGIPRKSGRRSVRRRHDLCQAHHRRQVVPVGRRGVEDATKRSCGFASGGLGTTFSDLPRAARRRTPRRPERPRARLRCR